MTKKYYYSKMRTHGCNIKAVGQNEIFFGSDHQMRRKTKGCFGIEVFFSVVFGNQNFCISLQDP